MILIHPGFIGILAPQLIIVRVWLDVSMANPISDFGSALITGFFLIWQLKKLGIEEKAV